MITQTTTKLQIGIAVSAWRVTRRAAVAASSSPWRPFSTTTTRPAKNQIFDHVRNINSLSTYLSLSTASHTPLLTLWTASWCPSCRHISPLLRSLIESGVGEAEGGVNYVPVEFDAPDAMELGTTYMISSIPTLLAFDARRGEPVARLMDAKKMADRQFVQDWIRNEASRYGGGGGGGSVFNGLFGNWK